MLATLIVFVAVWIISTSATSVCDDTREGWSQTRCSDGHTCCPTMYSGSTKGCCPYEHAVCCSNKLTCCPSGTYCVDSLPEGWPAWAFVTTCVSEGDRPNVTGVAVCKPGPPSPADSSRKNVLVIGDSVSIGYTPYVAKALSDIAFVQHAPWGGDGGAEETAYGLQCVEHFLRAPNGSAYEADVIMFNWGLHDGPQLFNNPPANVTVPGQEGAMNVYGTQLEQIVMKLRAHQQVSGGELLFAVTSPMLCNVRADADVSWLNVQAKKIMVKHGIHMVDLHAAIVGKCGPAPQSSCLGAKGCFCPHCASMGYEWLAKNTIAPKIRSMLRSPNDEKSGCKDDEGCSLNGVCDVSNGICKCDASWEGDDCALLSLGEASMTSCGRGCAYHGYNGKNTTSWGGSVLEGDDGKYYMMAAEFSKGCNLGAWTTNSQVAAAVASRPEGPYSKYDTAVGIWAHNPQWVRVHDTYLIYTLGNGKPSPHGKEKDCGGASTNTITNNTHHLVWHDAVGEVASSRNVSFTIYYSSSVHGPWQSHDATIVNFAKQDNMDNWNPAPVVMPGGSIRIMIHTDPAPWAGEVIAEAKDWRGPYIPLTSDIRSMTIPKTNEDPFMWQDHRGNWHVLVHRMFDPPGGSPIPSPGWTGGHAFSRDGLTWSNISRSYNTTVRMTDGTSWEALRRERPKLLFDKQGKMRYLFNGITTDDEGTYTLAVPITTGNTHEPFVV